MINKERFQLQRSLSFVINCFSGNIGVFKFWLTIQIRLFAVIIFNHQNVSALNKKEFSVISASSAVNKENWI
jgi:hypothetical protein